MTISSSTTGELREELRGDVQKVAENAKDRILSDADAYKGTAASHIASVSDALKSVTDQLHEGPDWLKGTFQRVADAAQGFASSVENKNSSELVSDIQKVARQNPGTFLVGCAIAGFAAARTFKAGGTQADFENPTFDPEQSAPGASSNVEKAFSEGTDNKLGRPVDPNSTDHTDPRFMP